MSPPFHTSPPVPVQQPADEVHRRLTADPEALVTAATADALHRSAPLLRRWGLTPSALPSTTCAATGGNELGTVTIRWSGDEEATGWPSTSAQLLITPTGTDTCELRLLTTRSPEIGLAAGRLGEFHGRRAVRLVVDSFLRALADQVGHDQRPERAERDPASVPDPVEVSP